MKAGTMTERERGFVEGLIDGEGYIGLINAHGKNSYWYPTIQISNSCYALLEKAKSIIGGKIYDETHDNHRWKRAYRLRLRQAEIRRLLPKIRLIAKEQQRILLLRAIYFIDCKVKDELEPIKNHIQMLNRRGPR